MKNIKAYVEAAKAVGAVVVGQYAIKLGKICELLSQN